MRSLFRAFEAARVRYLVIRGQASVLYGAAHFSQDLDLWVEPTAANLRALLRALSRLQARVHKLTPPIAIPLLRRGHGFHFVVPARGGPPLYLDIMGQPPRVGRFAPAYARPERMSTSWGTLPVVGIEDLVELKKTNRPADYDVITRLATIRLGQDERPVVTVIRWAVRNIFRVEDLWAVIERFGERIAEGAPDLPAAARSFLRIRRQGRRPTLADFSRAAVATAREAVRLQNRGRAYWLPLLHELRRLRAEGRLIPEGTPVVQISTGSRRR